MTLKRSDSGTESPLNRFLHSVRCAHSGRNDKGFVTPSAVEGSIRASRTTTGEHSGRKGVWSFDRVSKSRTAVTLIEVMSAIVILVIAVLGASGYRYYSTLDARRADFQNAAARIALLLCENWRGRGYDPPTPYNPVVHLTSANLTVATSGTGPDYAEGFTGLGRYDITMDGVHYWAALSYDAGTDGLRTLNVVVAWAQRQTGSDEAEAVAAGGGDRTFRLTTYVSE